ncbi:hypothetical protein [Trinickia dinghuensis]|uniref:hypothetical protein n=1 Tax=Trinickia dinghuensis TaxID=2291023 RepID=UPI0015F15C60|nr:hypothetical protein [Trinickia dinghuensis]
MRSFNSVVAEARLVVNPAETVVRYLEDRGAQVAKQPFSDTADEQFEQALLERHDPLIDLALARWCCHLPTGRALLAANAGDSAHALANSTAPLLNTTVASETWLRRFNVPDDELSGYWVELHKTPKLPPSS